MGSISEETWWIYGFEKRKYRLFWKLSINSIHMAFTKGKNITLQRKKKRGEKNFRF